MKRKYYIAVALICISILICVATGVIEKGIREHNEGARLNYTDEMIIQQGYFELYVPAVENRHLQGDVYSYSQGDGYIHIVLPRAVSENHVVAYVKNQDGVSLARRVFDFTKDNYIGQWQIVLDRPTLPTMYFSSGVIGDFADMCAAPAKEKICYGDVRIAVDKQMAEENGWYEEYISVEGDSKEPHSASLIGRGLSSWECNSKKSFTLKLDKAEDLLGMGRNKSWNLVGSAYDVSLLKNLVFNDLSIGLGISYQPQIQPVNFYVDGRYQGVYLLTTKVSVDKDRVSLGKDDYFYKMDPPTYEQPLYYESQTWFCDGNDFPVADLLYPKSASENEKADAQAKLQEFINAMEDQDSDRIFDLVDLDSLVRYYWIQEAGMNFDAWQRSVYIYYDASDKKMHMGPVWDMDLTLGSPYEKEGMMFDYPEGFRVMNAGWYKALFTREKFVRAVIDSYFEGGVRQALFESLDDFYKQKDRLAGDAYLNYLHYGHANLGVTLDYGGENYDEYCENMINFYRRRLEWIDTTMQSYK